MIDTHSHIYLKDFDEDREQMMARAKDAGVEKIYLPNIDSSSIERLKNLAENDPCCIPMMGLHPGSVKADFEKELSIVIEEFEKNPKFYKALGEIGIDLYWDKTFIEAQKYCFAKQIELAKKHNLPIVIHCRDAFNEVFEVLEDHADDQLFGIFHCFTGNENHAERAVELGLKLGIGGVVTFKNGGLDKVVENLNLKDLVLETDAPYLSPSPYRGKRNEPSYLLNIAQKIADLHQIPLAELQKICTKNSLEIFKDE